MHTFKPEELRARAQEFDLLAERTSRISSVESARVWRDAAALRALADLLEREIQPPTINLYVDHASVNTTVLATFWLVWRDGGKQSPRFESAIPHIRHDSSDSARTEAERLAKANPGVRFYVVPARSYAVAAIMPVAWGSVVAEDVDGEVPF